MMRPALASTKREGSTAAPAQRRNPTPPPTTSVVEPIGNLQLLDALGIRAKLKFSAPGDADEHEADRAADAYLGARRPAKGACCSACGSATPTVHRKAIGAPRVPSTRVSLPSGSGTPLGRETRRDYESFFGVDLSAVRVHTADEAAAMSDRIGARAFTIGSNIAFAPGEFAPQTASGKKLLAHELTHVVQQSGGSAGTSCDGRRVRASDANVQADGQLTPADIEMMRTWLETGSTKKPQTDQEALAQWMGTSGTGSAPLPLAQLRDPRLQLPMEFPSARFGAGPGDFGTLGDRPTFKPAGPPPGTICPNCHQTPQEQWEAAQKREAERKEQARRAAWPGMHRAQHATELAQQATTLREDVATSELAAAQLRLQMFDRALARPADPVVDALLGAPSELLSAGLRDKWLLAQQATTVLDALLQATDETIPVDVTAPIQVAYNDFYGALAVVLEGLDSEERRRAEQFEQRLLLAPKKPPPCPNCHTPMGGDDFAGTPLLPSYATSAFPIAGARAISFSSGFGGASGGSTSALTSIDTATLNAVGPRITHLNGAIAALNAAATKDAWKAVREDFRWGVAVVDRLIRSRLSGDEGSRELIEQFDFTQALLQRQQAFLDTHADALKIQAIFYPKNEFTQREDEQGISREVARGIPWNFYLVRTPIEKSGEVPAGYTWELWDLTAPKRDERYVKTSYQVTAFEALGRERGPWADPLPIDQMDPPPSLFEELNHRDFFPEGMLYFRYPLSGKPGEQEMTAPRPFGEWLTLIGMAIAVLGSLILAPMFGAFSVPVLLTAFGGTTLSILGRVHRLGEMQEHGILTQGDIDRFYWDLSLDLVNMLTLGLGRVMTVSAQAGNLLRATSAARAYFFVRRAQIAMDVINIGVVTNDFVQQYRAIQNSNMTPEQKSEAMRSLTMHAMLAGGMTLVMLRSGAHDWNKRPQLAIDVDPRNPGQLVADFVGVGEAEQLATRAQSGAKVVKQIHYTHPETGETHSYALWSDGRLTRCSPPPCLQVAESVVSRLDELSEGMLSQSEHRPDLEDLAGRARKLREEGEALAAAPAKDMAAKSDAILARVRALEEEIVGLEKRVRVENKAAEITGREEAQNRYGAAALDYNREHYRWVWNKERGVLEFQRRSQAVPWKRFNPDTGKFEVTRTLFVPVDPARLEQVKKTSLTSDFPIVATIDNVSDLRRLRPASATKTAPPKDWVLVKINDDNLVDFYTEPVPHGTIFEFPDGSRVWRTPQNTIATEGAVRAPIGRRGFERGNFPQLRGDNEGVPVIEATGVEHQRAHPRGQGTGFELYNHIPLAPTYVNQQLQARGIELYIDELRKLHPDVDFRLSTEHTTFTGTNRQAWIDYHLSIVDANGRRQLFSLRIGTDYSNQQKPAQTEIRGLTTNQADLALLHSVDMTAAVAALEARIQRAQAARRTR